MNRDESIKILAVLKAAYPNSYKGMTKEEAIGTIGVWTTQFSSVPYFVVALAVNKLISTSNFPPSIHEVKDKIKGLYYEAKSMLDAHGRATVGIRVTGAKDEEPIKIGKPLDDKTLSVCKEIVKVCEPSNSTHSLEASLGELIQGMHKSLESGEHNLLGT